MDGNWVASASGKEIETFNPATGKAIANLVRGKAEDVDRAVKAARRALKSEWETCKPYDRQKLLIRVHDVVEKNFDELAYLETLDTGTALENERPERMVVPGDHVLCHAEGQLCGRHAL